MLVLLALPVILAVAALHRFLQVYAPSNVLARHVHARQPSWPTAAGLVGVAGLLLVAMHAVAAAPARGAPGWLNLVVLILAWDAIKVCWLALIVGFRVGAQSIRGYVSPHVRGLRPNSRKENRVVETTSQV